MTKGFPEGYHAGTGSSLPANRAILCAWASQRTEPWNGAMEATLSSGWIYDTLKPFAAELPTRHPAMTAAIGASKQKNGQLDAQQIGGLARCKLLPVCYVAPREWHEVGRLLRYRNLVAAPAPRWNPQLAAFHEQEANRGVRPLHPGFTVRSPFPAQAII